jgi:hypothetical protein
MTRLLLTTGQYLEIDEYFDALSVDENGYYRVTLTATSQNVMLQKTHVVWIENTVTPT